MTLADANMLFDYWGKVTPPTVLMRLTALLLGWKPQEAEVVENIDYIEVAKPTADWFANPSRFFPKKG